MPEGNPIRPAINPLTDIPIPDDVYVEEQYSDMLEIIDYILPLLAPYDFNNSTSEGRLRGELKWAKQEVESKRFPIPGKRSTLATVNYLSMNYYLPADMMNIREELGHLVSLVTCNGFIKSRHYPRIIEFINQLIHGIERVLDTDTQLVDSEKSNLLDLKFEMTKLAKQLYAGTATFPLDKKEWPAYWDKMARGDVWDRDDEYYQLERKLSGPLTSRWRPRQSQPTEGWIMPEWVKEPIEPIKGNAS